MYYTQRIICSKCHEQIPIRPRNGSLGGCKNILKYLRRTKDVFLICGDGDLIVNGYSDASFQSDRDDSKSQSGYVFTLNGGAVSWKSSK